MLRLSKMTDYGTVIMAQMATRPADIFSATEVAAASGLTATTASKVLKTLAHGGLVKSVRGSKGGYVLARPPERISVADVIAVMEGTVAVTECSAHPGACAQEAHCPSRDKWQHVSRMVQGVLARVSLLDIGSAPPAAGTPTETKTH